MKLKTLFLAVVAALAGFAAEPVDSGTHFAADALKPFVDNGQLPGAISVFYQNGKQEVACVGYADAGKKRPITLDDVYMQCSQTKGFCGVTIAILVEEGKISLDDPVSKYIPEFGTLWIEKSNKDGVRTPMGGWSRRMPLRSVALVAASQPILFEPGTRQQYSNVGIDIGAAVVERVTGKRWEDFLKERVFLPLGMKDSGFWPTKEQLEKKVEMYTCRKGKPAVWTEHDRSMQRPYSDDRVFPSAGAGLWTTARDQLKFYKMLMNLGVGENGARILKDETVKSILAVSTRPQGLGGYSLGLSAPVKDGENEWFGHGGAWGTNCMVNWHKKQLKLWTVQLRGGPRPWDGPREKAANEFFKTTLDTAGEKAYTGRLK